MRNLLIVAGTFITLLVTAGAAAAQPRWDVAASTGGWWGRPEGARSAQPYDDEWFASWLGSVGVGRHWTDHIKTELDFTVTSTGTRYVTREVQLPGERSPRFVTQQELHHERSVAALVTWQAGRNWWVHPFVQGGVSVDWDRAEAEAFPIFITGPVPIVIPSEGSTTRTVARGVAAGGAKFYMSERAFFRADVRTSFGAGATHVQFRTGFGFDF